MNVSNHNNLVDPNEVISIALTYNNNFISDIETVKAIKQAVNENCTESDKKDRIWFNACLCVTLFHAGRIQGIREERTRRKSAQ